MKDTIIDTVQSHKPDVIRLEAGNRLSISQWMKERPKGERRNERKMKSKVITLISVILIAMFVAIPPVGAKGETSYSFTLMGPNVSKAAATIPSTHIKKGDWIRLVGAGTFDTSTGAVSGGGAYTHFNYDGTVHGRGTWKVKEFVSFDSGLLKIRFHAISTSEVAEFDLMMQISSEGVTIWNPPGTVALFGVVVSGRTLFHQHG